ncbi:MAG: hypothetical protein ACKVOM_00530 [Ferruginibacter sp.]
MKKILTSLFALCFFSATTMAQVAIQDPPNATQSKVKAVAPLAKVAPVTKTTTVAPKPAATSRAVVLKKDGTPDKRYNNVATAFPLKKDGTSDKRYKPNKKS